MLLLFLTFVLVAAYGLLTSNATSLSLAAAVWGFGLAAVQLRHSGLRGLSPLFMFAFFAGLIGLANTVGFLAAEGANRDVFFLYPVEENFVPAMEISLLGTLSITAGYVLAERWCRKRGFGLLPKIRGEFPPAILSRVLPVLAAGALAVHIFDVSLNIGAIWALVEMFPIMVAFTLAYEGWLRSRLSLVVLAFAVGSAESVRAYLFDYLRSATVMPMAALLLGSLQGAGSWRPLRHWTAIVIYAGMIVFVLTFAAFGANRAGSLGVGASRLEELASAVASQRGDREEPSSATHFLARFSSFNQLSQVCRVVNEDGYYSGKTLDYMAIAFIPRFLWPAKPPIAKGGWFAERIGLASEKEGGLYSNSIDMTIAGELYLNFGLGGVAVGGLLVGLFFATVWATTTGMSPNSGLATLFRAYLLLSSVTFGADLQIVVTVTAFYLMFLALSTALGRGRVHAHTRWDHELASHRSLGG